MGYNYLTAARDSTADIVDISEQDERSAAPLIVIRTDILVESTGNKTALKGDVEKLKQMHTLQIAADVTFGFSLNSSIFFGFQNYL